MSKGNRKEKISKKGLILRFTILISYLLVLIYIYFVLLEFGSHPLVIFSLLTFIFLITLGPFLRKKKGSLYSRMFPDRKKRPIYQRERRKRTPVIKKEPKQIQPKVFQAIDLEFEYRKPLISDCENCGNILPNFVKDKCPFCGEQV
jgi:hypothetical protein